MHVAVSKARLWEHLLTRLHEASGAGMTMYEKLGTGVVREGGPIRKVERPTVLSSRAFLRGVVHLTEAELKTCARPDRSRNADETVALCRGC